MFNIKDNIKALARIAVLCSKPNSNLGGHPATHHPAFEALRAQGFVYVSSNSAEPGIGQASLTAKGSAALAQHLLDLDSL